MDEDVSNTRWLNPYVALSNKLCPRNSLLVAVHHGELIPSLVSALEEDYYADTRAASCHAMRHLLLTAGDKLTDEHRRAVYPELLKRMDDSRNEIRVAGAGVVAAFFDAMPADYDETNTGYLLKGAGGGGRGERGASCIRSASVVHSLHVFSKLRFKILVFSLYTRVSRQC